MKLPGTCHALRLLWIVCFFHIGVYGGGNDNVTLSTPSTADEQLTSLTDTYIAESTQHSFHEPQLDGSTTQATSTIFETAPTATKENTVRTSGFGSKDTTIDTTTTYSQTTPKRTESATATSSLVPSTASSLAPSTSNSEASSTFTQRTTTNTTYDTTESTTPTKAANTQKAVPEVSTIDSTTPLVTTKLQTLLSFTDESTSEASFSSTSAFENVPTGRRTSTSVISSTESEDPTTTAHIVSELVYTSGSKATEPTRQTSTNRKQQHKLTSTQVTTPTVEQDLKVSIKSTTTIASTPTTTPGATEDRYFVVIKSDDCPTLKANKFDRELSKALSALGVLNVTADISQTECQTKLNVNITATAPYSAIKLLEDSKKHNLTITIFNRTFKVVDIQKLDTTTRSSTSDSTPNVVNAVTDQEFNTYVAVGVCFGVVLLVCLTACCIKCWINGPSKKLRALRRTHTPLSPEDYTLTPLPRPTSLYVDYCRNSFTGDVCSTTSAGSVASTSPIVEKGIVQPFETCIVPLEDTAVPVSDRRDSTGSNCRPMSNMQILSGHALTPGEAPSGDMFNSRPYVCEYRRAAGMFNPSYHSHRY